MAVPIVATVLGIGGCQAPYRPALVELGPSPRAGVHGRRASDPDVLHRTVVDTVLTDYSSLAHETVAPLRIATSWTPFERGEVPGQKRAIVYRDGDRLAVIVEVRFLQIPLIGSPQWGAPRTDRVLEDRLARQLERAASSGG